MSASTVGFRVTVQIRAVAGQPKGTQMKKVLLALTAAMVMSTAIQSSTASAHFYAGCQKYTCKAHVVKPFKERLERMHHCEARGVGWFSDGLHDGGLQFTVQTWRATGSKFAFAYQASKTEQMYRAVVWAAMINWQWRSRAGWPNCG